MLVSESVLQRMILTHDSLVSHVGRVLCRIDKGKVKVRWSEVETE